MLNRPAKLTLAHPPRTKMTHLSHEVIVLLIIIGCIAFVFIGYGVYALATGLEHESDGYRNPSNEQAQYMREVRGRNLGVMAFESRRVRQGRGKGGDGGDDMV